MTNTKRPALQPVRLLPLEPASDVTAGASAPLATRLEQPAQKRRLNMLGSIAVRASLAVLALGTSIGLVRDGGTAHAAPETATYQVVDGPWYIHTSDPVIHSATVGLAQTGDTLAITCHVTGDLVDGDAEWDKVTDLNNGLQGFIADKGTNTPVTEGNEAAQLTGLGIAVCGSDSNQTSPEQTPSFYATLFFSGTEMPTGTNKVSKSGTVQYYGLNDWSGGNCSLDTVWGDIQSMPSTVHTLAGWSRGRLGPLYFLWTATQEQRDQIHTIVLYDPGSTIDFAEPPLYKRVLGDQTCDWQYDPATTYYGWLHSNPAQNRLIIITGKDSEMKDNPNDPNSHSNYAGLWQYYFSKVWQTGTATQVTVCDYNNLGHPEALEDFSALMGGEFSGACPAAPDNTHTLTQWNP